MKPDITLLHECFNLEEDGTLIWKHRPDDHFPSPAVAKSWRSRFAGKKAGSVNSDGYLHVAVNCQLIKVHQIVFAMTNGHWATGQIDHKDGVRTNNRPDNLRDVTSAVNGRNRKAPASNTSGRVGVYMTGGLNPWTARIGHDCKDINLGRFRTRDEAIAARVAAERSLGYSATHGRKS